MLSFQQKSICTNREELNNRAYVHTYTFGRIVIDVKPVVVLQVSDAKLGAVCIALLLLGTATHSCMLLAATIRAYCLQRAAKLVRPT